MPKGSLDVKLPTIWTDEKQRWEESEKRREEERRKKKEERRKKKEERRKKKKEERGKRKEERGKRKEERGKRKEDQKSKSLRRKKIQVREKVGRSRNTVFFQWFVGPEVRKVGSLKRRVRSRVVRWEMKSCTPLWREAHFQVKMYKTHQHRTTFGSCDVEKVDADVARSTFPSQNAQNTSVSDHFWELRCRKSARRCGGKRISKSKCNNTCSDHFWTFRCRCAWQAQGIVHHCMSRVSKRWRFCSMSKNDGRRGTFEEDLQRYIFHGRRSTRDMFIRDVRRSGHWFRFWEDDFAWHVQHFVWPGLTCSWQAQYFRQVEWKNHKTHWHEAVSSALSFPFLKDVSQNCFVFDVVNFKNWGSLAELFRFWRCQIQKLRKSRRIAAFLMFLAE